jgi:hypothetical protein
MDGKADLGKGFILTYSLDEEAGSIDGQVISKDPCRPQLWFHYDGEQNHTVTVVQPQSPTAAEVVDELVRGGDLPADFREQVDVATKEMEAEVRRARIEDLEQELVRLKAEPNKEILP